VTEAAIPRRGEVLATAEQLFARRGFHATSVRDIADALNIKGGSLYAHIESKEDLLWELVSAAAERFMGALRPILASDLVPVERLRKAVVAHVHVITSNLEAAAVFTNEWKCLSEERRREFAATRDEYEHAFRQMVTDCIRSGAFADVDEKFATLLILSSANWIFQWYRPDGPMTPEEIARKLTDLLLNGLRRASA
jgi:AcrR family transcriptional regulator